MKEFKDYSSKQTFDKAINTLIHLCYYNSADFKVIQRPPYRIHYQLIYEGYVNNTSISFNGLSLKDPFKLERALEKMFKPFLFDLTLVDRSWIMVRELTPNQLKEYGEKNQLSRNWLYYLKAELHLMKSPYESLKKRCDDMEVIDKRHVKFDLD